MQDKYRRHSLYFTISLVNSVVSSLSVLAAVFVNTEGKNKVVLIVFASVFWITLVLEQVFFWKADRIMKELVRLENRKLRSKVGIFSIAASGAGLVADVIFAVSLIALIICAGFSIGEELLQFILICLMVLSFRLHCFLNGKNYKYKSIVKKGRS